MTDSYTPIADCWFLSGPTAGGKTAVGLELARRIGAEIISLDSMAVYRGMEIGTAKPTPAEQASVPHHLLDLVDPRDDSSVADYLVAAREAVAEIRARGREALFVGGTPLYLKTLLRGIFVGPAADWEYRTHLEQLAERQGPAELHRQLAAVDPTSAARLHPNDARRLIRALEVHRATGASISGLQQQFATGRPAADCRVFVLEWPREELVARIDRRVDAMFAAGLVEETRGLLADGNALSRTAGQAVGYREVVEHLSGLRDLPATIERVKIRTRQFAKRQLTWFRSLSECRSVAVAEPLDVADVARRIEQGAKESDKTSCRVAE